MPIDNVALYVGWYSVLAVVVVAGWIARRISVVVTLGDVRWRGLQSWMDTADGVRPVTSFGDVPLLA